VGLHCSCRRDDVVAPRVDPVARGRVNFTTSTKWEIHSARSDCASKTELSTFSPEHQSSFLRGRCRYCNRFGPNLVRSKASRTIDGIHCFQYKFSQWRRHSQEIHL